MECALKAGYRHVDTAMFYKNERKVGRGIRNSKIARRHIFIRIITSKLSSEAHDTVRGETVLGVCSSLKKLNVDAIDLYLIHSPFGKNNVATCRELLKCKQKGLVKSVGVNNYVVHHLRALDRAGLPPPAVNVCSL